MARGEEDPAARCHRPEPAVFALRGLGDPAAVAGKTYKAMGAGKLPTFPVGRRTYVYGRTLIELSRPPAEWPST